MAYRGGRVKGKKNLTKEGKKLVNQYDVKFTEKEKAKLESLVNSANRKRNKMLKDEKNLPRFVAGTNTGKTLGETTSLMGKESDFILAKKSKSLQRFKTKEEYKKYVKNLQKVVDRDYIKKRVELYRKNDIKAMKNVFGKDSAPLIKILKTLTDKQYMDAVQKDETLEIGHKYSPESREAKLKQMKDALELFKNAPKKKSRK